MATTGITGPDTIAGMMAATRGPERVTLPSKPFTVAFLTRTNGLFRVGGK